MLLKEEEEEKEGEEEEKVGEEKEREKGVVLEEGV